MKKLLNKTKIFAIIFLAMCMLLSFMPAVSVFADDEAKLTLKEFLSDSKYADHNITSNLPFNTDFEGDTENERIRGWQTAGDLSTGNQTITADMTSEDEITTTREDTEDGVDDSKINKSGLKYSEVKASKGKYAMLLLNLNTGVSAIESKEYIKIPARAKYLLTIDVKVAKISNANGVYIQLVEGENAFKAADSKDLFTYTITKIKSTNETIDDKEQAVYVTYALLIEGNELVDTQAKIQISLGYRTTKDSDTLNEIGVAAIDNLQMFTISSEEASLLKSDAHVTTANFSTIKSSQLDIANGTFNSAENQDYNYDGKALLIPTSWVHETSLNNTESQYGIINTNATLFAKNEMSTKEYVVNPGLSTYQVAGDLNERYNNVLIMYNKTNTHQKLANSFKLAKNSIYEFTFEFCTPALFEKFEDENNSLSFYLKNNENVIYSKENVFSYSTHTKDLTEWTRYSFIIETGDETVDLTFEIVFGTKDNAKKGSAFVDNVLLLTRSSESAFDNIYSDTLKFSEEDKFLKPGYASLEDVKNLQENKYVSTYSFKKADENTGDEDNDADTDENKVNLTYLWYVIPSALLAVCTIGGLIIFYGRKLKNKKFNKNRKTKNKKVTYSRLSKQNNIATKTKNKNIENEKIGNVEEIEKPEEAINAEELTIEKQIANLDKAYEDKQIALKDYMKKRKKLEKKLK